MGEINAGCGHCPRCLRGDPRHCPTRTVLGIVGRDGAHAEKVRLPARNLLRVPDGVSDEQAVFAEPLGAACGVLERCPMEDGTRVAVLGDGKLGLLCAMTLAAQGFEPLLVGKHESKLAIARARGIEVALVADARQRGRSFEVVVEASGGASGFDLALDLLQPQGTLVLKSDVPWRDPGRRRPCRRRRVSASSDCAAVAWRRRSTCSRAARWTRRCSSATSSLSHRARKPCETPVARAY